MLQKINSDNIDIVSESTRSDESSCRRLDVQTRVCKAIKENVFGCISHNNYVSVTRCEEKNSQFKIFLWTDLHVGKKCREASGKTFQHCVHKKKNMR